MNYHNILHDAMRTRDGLRVVLFVAGCDHYCDECHNPQTWDSQSGIEFDSSAVNEIFTELCKEHISGITFSGGDPLNEHNLDDVLKLITDIRNEFADTKTIWIYSGYTFDEVMGHTSVQTDAHCKRAKIVSMCDIMVDGEFEKEKADINYHWAGSTNQRVIDIQKTLEADRIVLHK